MSNIKIGGQTLDIILFRNESIIYLKPSFKATILEKQSFLFKDLWSTEVREQLTSIKYPRNFVIVTAVKKRLI